MDIKLFDSHCHLYMPQFDADRAEVLARMQERGMGAVVIGVDLASSKKALELAQSRGFLWSSVGLHPNDAPPEKWIDISIQMEELARDPKVVAIGECGLDYYRQEPTREIRDAQRERFEAQIALAEKLGKALVVHCRPSGAKAMEGKDAHEDCSNVLQNYGITKKVPVIMHFFTGSEELVQKYLDLGCYLSFPGPITYADMYDAVRATPLERMLIETDAPYAAPVPHRGKRNEPVFVEHVAAKIAALKGLPVEDVAKATTQNALKVFGLPSGE